MKRLGKTTQILGLSIMYIAGAIVFYFGKTLSLALIIISISLIMIGKFAVGYERFLKEEREENSIRNHRIQEGFTNE